MKKIFLENLPKKGNNIDWQNSVNKFVRAIYDDDEYNIYIESYDKLTGKLKITWSDNQLYISTGHFKNCQLGKLLMKTTSKFKINLGKLDKIGNNNMNLIITDRKCIDEGYIDKFGRSYIRKRKIYKYKCLSCGFDCGGHYKKGEYKDELWINEDSLIKGRGCSCCSGGITVPFINSIMANEYTQWMSSYFVNKLDAYKYTKSSNEYMIFKCPDCGNIKDKPMMINTLHRQHSIGCPICGDGISMPEKMMYNILEQLKIEFIFQLSKSHFEWIKKGIYDFYIPSLNLIIEMDGRFHNIDNLMSGQTKEESKYIDDYKNVQAKINGVHVIRVDCDPSEFDYIRNNILNSELKEKLKLNKIDWKECEEYTTKNICKMVCDIRKNNPEITSTDISKIVKLSSKTIITYLKKGNKLGWCNYDGKTEMRKSAKRASSSRKVAIICLDNMKIYDSANDIENYYSDDFGGKMESVCILRNCKGECIEYKGYHFKFYDNYLNGDNKIEYIICLNTNEIMTYKIAMEKFNIKCAASISSCCNGNAKTCGIHPETKEPLRFMFYDDYLKNETA